MAGFVHGHPRRCGWSPATAVVKAPFTHRLRGDRNKGALLFTVYLYRRFPTKDARLLLQPVAPAPWCRVSPMAHNATVLMPTRATPSIFRGRNNQPPDCYKYRIGGQMMIQQPSPPCLPTTLYVAPSIYQTFPSMIRATEALPSPALPASRRLRTEVSRNGSTTTSLGARPLQELRTQ